MTVMDGLHPTVDVSPWDEKSRLQAPSVHFDTASDSRRGPFRTHELLKKSTLITVLLPTTNNTKPPVSWPIEFLLPARSTPHLEPLIRNREHGCLEARAFACVSPGNDSLELSFVQKPTQVQLGGMLEVYEILYRGSDDAARSRGYGGISAPHGVCSRFNGPDPSPHEPAELLPAVRVACSPPQGSMWNYVNF